MMKGKEKAMDEQFILNKRVKNRRKKREKEAELAVLGEKSSRGKRHKCHQGNAKTQSTE
jgi:hypothetical protein